MLVVGVPEGPGSAEGGACVRRKRAACMHPRCGLDGEQAGWQQATPQRAPAPHPRLVAATPSPHLHRVTLAADPAWLPPTCMAAVRHCRRRHAMVETTPDVPPARVLSSRLPPWRSHRRPFLLLDPNAGLHKRAVACLIEPSRRRLQPGHPDRTAYPAPYPPPDPQYITHLAASVSTPSHSVPPCNRELFSAASRDAVALCSLVIGRG